jgi:hypothetical protein
MSRKRKHGTPKKLDKLFSREVISKSQYGEFWQGYWDSRNRNSYVNRFLKDLEPEGEVEPPPRRKKRSKASYRKSALKGWVTRRRNKRRKNVSRK